MPRIICTHPRRYSKPYVVMQLLFALSINERFHEALGRALVHACTTDTGGGLGQVRVGVWIRLQQKLCFWNFVKMLQSPNFSVPTHTWLLQTSIQPPQICTGWGGWREIRVATCQALHRDVRPDAYTRAVAYTLHLRHIRYGKMEADHKQHIADVKSAVIENRIQASNIDAQYSLRVTHTHTRFPCK